MERKKAIHLLRREYPRLSVEYGVRSIRLIGSTARGSSGPTSDIDILVEFRETPTLFTLARLKADLEEKTSSRVDVLMESGLRSRTRKNVLADAIEI